MRLMHLAEAAVLRQLPQLRSQHVASLLWSFVKLRYRPVGRVLTPTDAADATAAPRLNAATLPPPASSLAAWSPSADVRSTGPLPQELFSLLEQRAGELRLIERADEGIVAQVGQGSGQQVGRVGATVSDNPMKAWMRRSGTGK